MGGKRKPEGPWHVREERGGGKGVSGWAGDYGVLGGVSDFSALGLAPSGSLGSHLWLETPPRS